MHFHAAKNVVRYADVQRPPGLAGKNVNPIAAHRLPVVEIAKCGAIDPRDKPEDDTSARCEKSPSLDLNAGEVDLHLRLLSVVIEVAQNRDCKS